MAELVMRHPAIAGSRRTPKDRLQLFGPTDDGDLESLRFDAVGFLLSGAIAVGMTRDIDEDLATGLVHAAAMPDPESLLLRAKLTRRRLFEPPPRPLPEWLEPIESFIERNCFAGVIGAVLESGLWASVRPSSDAAGITSLSSKNVCPKTVLTIFGSFPDPKPADVRVYVPVAGGGCREATVTRWSDDEIDVHLPGDIGVGCVGFVRGTWEVGEPQQVTGELTNCVGAAAEPWTRGFQKLGGPVVDCPPCLPLGENRIELAGAPVINTFVFTPKHVEPSGQPVLSWNVSNATTVRIDQITGPTLALPNPLPLVGAITLPSIGGLVPVAGLYRLTARNGCGTVTRLATFTMSRTPSLSVARIEVVQSIQSTTNSVRLVASRRTAVRVFVDSGITDGFNLGVGPGRVSGIDVSVLAESLDTGSIFDCGSPWAPGQASPTFNRDLLADSVNFDVPLAACTGNVRFRVTVTMPGELGAPPVAFATGSADVAFEQKSMQMLLPLLITDPFNPSPPPTMASWDLTLQGPASAHPFPEQNGVSFLVNPPLPLTLSASESLRFWSSWERLILKLTTMGLLFQKTAVGGVRAGVVPPDPAYGKCGIALPRVGATVPSFVVVAGDTECCTHELAHCFGLLHVPTCGTEPIPFDGGLPLTISDPGLDVPGQIICPAGRPESMSYCSSPTWPSIQHWDRVFNRVPIS